MVVGARTAKEARVWPPSALGRRRVGAAVGRESLGGLRRWGHYPGVPGPGEVLLGRHMRGPLGSTRKRAARRSETGRRGALDARRGSGYRSREDLSEVLAAAPRGASGARAGARDEKLRARAEPFPWAGRACAVTPAKSPARLRTASTEARVRAAVYREAASGDGLGLGDGCPHGSGRLLIPAEVRPTDGACDVTCRGRARRSEPRPHERKVVTTPRAMLQTWSFPLAQAFGVLPVVGATGQFRTCPGQGAHVKDLTMGSSAGHQRVSSDGGAHEPRGPARRELRLQAKGAERKQSSFDGESTSGGPVWPPTGWDERARARARRRSVSPRGGDVDCRRGPASR